MRYILILAETGEQVERHAIDNGVIEYACGLTVELHNRDFPDPWHIEYEEPENVDETAL